MNTASSYEMTTSLGVQIPLTKNSISAELRNTALETTVTQHYLNNELEVIEGVYTFPLPVGATLLSLEINLNGDVLSGKVVASQEAEEAYEDAITDGDSALLLQKIDESRYTLNIGNLQPQDLAVISIRYIQLLCWHQNRLRIMYPTTIGDRYGRPADSGLQPHQITHEDPLVEYRTDFSLHVFGPLAACAVTCPSHSLSIKPEGDRLVIGSLPRGIPMDRDIIIGLERGNESTGCAGYFDRDLDGQWVGWLTLNPEFSDTVKQRNLTIAVDCSGSMSGISNQQAKIAVREIVELLRPEDLFNIIKFGSVAAALFPEPMPGSDANKAAALNHITHMNADMGGTEIGAALQLAYEGGKGDILLITDGQSYDVADVIENASQSGVRHFTIGVGTAVAEDMVQGLASATGGATELVSPNENMAEAIVRHAKRSYATPLSKSGIIWPVKPEHSIPEIVNHAFSGDTLNIFALFESKPQGETIVRFEFGDKVWSQTITMATYSDSTEESTLEELPLARVCAATRVKEATSQEQQRLGIQYQLQTDKTNYLLVAKRDIKDDSVAGPALRQVPQMIKANGRIDFLSADCAPRMLLGNQSVRDSYADSFHALPSKPCESQLDIEGPSSPSGPPVDFVVALDACLVRLAMIAEGKFPSRLNDLLAMGFDANVLESLRVRCKDGEPWNEEDVVAILLYIFAKNADASRHLQRPSIRAITRAYKKRVGLNQLEAAIWEAFSGGTASNLWQMKRPILNKIDTPINEG